MSRSARALQLLYEALKLLDSQEETLAAAYVAMAIGNLEPATDHEDCERSITQTPLKVSSNDTDNDARCPTLFSRQNENVVALHVQGNLEQLLHEHEFLNVRREALIALANGEPKPEEAERQLAEFKALIQSHRATERRCVYGPLMKKEIAGDSALGFKLNTLVEEINGDWETYLTIWNVKTIGRDWERFSRDTNQVLARAGERMRLEERVIYPLAFMGGMITLRSPRVD